MPVTNKRSLQTQIWPRGSQRLSTGLEKFHCNVTLKTTLLGKTIFHLHRAPPLPLPPAQSLEQTQGEQSPLPPGHPFHPFAKASSPLCPGAPIPTHLAPSAYPGEPAAADGTITERNIANQGYKSIRSAQHRENQANKGSHGFREPGERAGPIHRSRVLEGKPGPSARRTESAPRASGCSHSSIFMCPFAPVH